ncbi:MAG: glycosyltransferase [Spirochaetales bacterium]|nr:glycosyltransferase [Spirochaetales bacterium]
MKIVIVIDSWNEGNGAIVATKRMVSELEKRGHKITVVTTGKYDGDFYTVPGFYLPGVEESMQNMGFLFGKGIKKTYKQAFKDADIVQIQFPFFMAKNAVNVAKKMGIPVLGACHIQPQNVISAMGKENKLMEAALSALFNFCLFKQVPDIHCPSQFAADLIFNHGSRANFHIISNGIPEMYRPSNFERPDWFGDKFVIVNIGRHAFEKRQHLLVEGVKRSKYKDNIQLLLCGKGENSEMLRNISKDLPIKPLIEYVSDEDKLKYLNTADLYLHSSIIELESLSCLEAIGCGLPCLISDAPYSAAPQFALDERFLFEKDNADQLAEKIDYWYEHRKELPEIKKKVLAEAENYRFRKCIDQMEELYIKIQQKTESARGYINVK